ncbi:craniofacial development protein 2-like protein [Willisornis vidua]|uniref:Craniofacial development protein 2-like protein n=1 Tax=Willisornis vidua TaxID=1566151 RepID=A0ABQ9D847_9PASS|nr:craniofacial development protein 2-like protein [Willisornis vidua]
MGDGVKSYAEVQIDYIHSLPLIHQVPCDHTQDDLFHNLAGHQGQADRHVVSQILLLALLMDGNHIGQLSVMGNLPGRLRLMTNNGEPLEEKLVCPHEVESYAGGGLCLRSFRSIISLCLPLHNKQHVVLFSLYAPTLQANLAEKDKFYTDLHRFTQNVPADDKIIILGDFHARVGKNSEGWKGVLGKHGIGNCSDNRCLLLEFCAEQQLTITNTIFQQKDSLKTTWIHPRSKHWHLIDYVLVQQRFVRDVCHTQVMPSAECQTDHCLLRCNLTSTLRPNLGGVAF